MEESPPHFRAPSARATIRPTTNRNMATDSNTVMTTMPPVRAIPKPIDSMFLPVRRRKLLWVGGGPQSSQDLQLSLAIQLASSSITMDLSEQHLGVTKEIY